jgi:hypothetical protein
MNRIVLAAIVAALTTPAIASDQTDIAAVVNGYNKDFAPKACASPASIIDEFAPHSWMGPTACADWLKSFDANSKANAITDAVVTLGKQETLKVDGDRAYAVYAANYNFKQKGKPVHEVGTWTFAFQKMAGGWKITAWTWSAH